VTLDRDGALRAFVNVCRHRGALVASAPQRRGTLQCPYHAWTYGLDGALRAAPRSDLEPCFDRDGLGLLPVAVDTWGPFLFVNPDPDAEPLAVALGDLPAVVAEHGLDIGALRHRRRVSYELRANWKVAIENYLECYRCAINHPGFVDAVDERALRAEGALPRLSEFAPVHARALDGGAVRRPRRPVRQPVPPAAGGHEAQRVPGAPQPVHRPGVAARARPLRRLPRLLLRRRRRCGVDRRVHRLGRPGRR
jgi:choline monooxygenase